MLVFDSSVYSVLRIFTLYSKSLPLDVACRVWDVFCRDGEEALFRTGLGILRLYQDVLLQMDFIHSAQFLSRLPENTPAHTLFSCIANTQMISNNRRWNQVRNTHLHFFFSFFKKELNQDNFWLHFQIELYVDLCEASLTESALLYEVLYTKRTKVNHISPLYS